MELGGTGPGQFDQLNVKGTVSLGGATLDVSLVNPFNPAPGDSFIIILNDGSDRVQGTFAGLVDGAVFTADGEMFLIDYDGGDGNDVVLTVFTITAPVEGANAGLTVAEGATGTITTALLDFNDAEQADTAITYTVTSAATNGTLLKNGVAVGVNGTFTQADINNDLISYRHDGSETATASFGFSVSDGAGETVTGQTFSFTVTPVNDAPVIEGNIVTASASGLGLGFSSTLTNSLDITAAASGQPVAIRVVNLDISHTWASDLIIRLVAPNGSSINLSSAIGGADDNYRLTTFDDAAAVSITAGSAPFNGSFRPQQPLSTLLSSPVNGTWTLSLLDTEPVFDLGVLNGWGLEIEYQRTLSTNEDTPLRAIDVLSTVVNPESGQTLSVASATALHGTVTINATRRSPTHPTRTTTAKTRSPTP